MALPLDPQSTVEATIGGVTYLLRILTQREMARFQIHGEAIKARIAGTPEGEVAVLDEDDIRRVERCLQLGVAGWKDAPTMPKWRCDAEGKRHMAADLLDAIPFGDWMALYLAIARANTVTEGDRKNSPSPPQ